MLWYAYLGATVGQTSALDLEVGQGRELVLGQGVGDRGLHESAAGDEHGEGLGQAVLDLLDPVAYGGAKAQRGGISTEYIASLRVKPLLLRPLPPPPQSSVCNMSGVLQ